MNFSPASRHRRDPASRPFFSCLPYPSRPLFSRAPAPLSPSTPKCIENTFSLIQSTFKSSEMHSTLRYKSCICSVFLGQLESFRNHLGPQYYFPENFRCIFRFYESENFCDSSFHRIFDCENFRFPFSTKNRLTWGLKCEKLNFRKSLGLRVGHSRRVVVCSHPFKKTFYTQGCQTFEAELVQKVILSNLCHGIGKACK